MFKCCLIDTKGPKGVQKNIPNIIPLPPAPACTVAGWIHVFMLLISKCDPIISI